MYIPTEEHKTKISSLPLGGNASFNLKILSTFIDFLVYVPSHGITYLAFPVCFFYSDSDTFYFSGSKETMVDDDEGNLVL